MSFFFSLSARKKLIKIPHFIWLIAVLFLKDVSRWKKKEFCCEFYWPFLTRSHSHLAKKWKKESEFATLRRQLRGTIAIWETAMRKMRNDHRMQTKCVWIHVHISFYFIYFILFSVGRKIAVNIILQTANTDKCVWMNIFVCNIKWVRKPTETLLCWPEAVHHLDITDAIFKMKWVWEQTGVTNT